MTVEPAVLTFDAHGVPVSARYGDVYASRDGALGQARHVFLGGTQCSARWAGRAQFVVLESGFGLGVNFLATWQAWRDDAARPDQLHYVAIERHPLPAAALVDSAPAELAGAARQLAGQWPLPLPGLHRLEFEQGRVMLTLALGDARVLAPELQLGADALYLDGFAPERNPEMWEPRLLRALARTARRDARVATWSTARAVRASLAEAGFEIALVPGFGHKRHMLVGRYAPRYPLRRHEPPACHAGERSAVVVGAGLAGAACARALAHAGWRVHVLDSAPPASGASALPWGAFHPQFAADDSVLARLTRAGSAAALRALRRDVPDGSRAGSPVWRQSGFFQQVRPTEDPVRWRETLSARGLPLQHVEWLEADAAARRLGMMPARAGLWWHDGALVSPPRWIGALLDAPGIVVARAAVAGVRRAGERWNVLGTRGEIVASASLAVFAAALETPRLLGSSAMPVQAIPGQVTFVRAPALASLQGALGGDGTLLHAPDGSIAIGATYETSVGRGNVPLDARMATRSNLARLERLLAWPVDVQVEGHHAGVRCVARDRLPYAGAVADESAIAAARLRGAHPADLPRRPLLYASFAHGSRALTFAALAAEVIVAQAEGAPLPVERGLANALDPGRVLLRRLRRGEAEARSA